MKYSLNQAKVWAAAHFRNKFVDHYWEATEWGYSTMSGVPSDFDYNYEPTREERLSIAEFTRREVLWAVEKKFGKKFGAKGYRELVKHVKGLH